MPPHRSPSDRLRSLFHRRKCWMLEPLAQTLGYALISVRRFLKQIGYFRSYTHNGKWYTLRDSPEFNRDGLWRHRGIGFSRHGDLSATIRYLVGSGPAGLSARELSQRLEHPCHAVLTQLHHAGQLDRLQVGGQFRYLATAPELNRQQREHAALLQPCGPASALSTQAAVWVLVEHIKNPALDVAQLAARLQEQRQLGVAPETIERFFQEHDLKKTPATPS